MPDSSLQLDQRNTQTSHLFQNTLILSYTEPLSLTQKVEVTNMYLNNLNQGERSVLESNAGTGLYDCPNALLCNHFSSLFATHRIGTTLQTRRLNYTYALGIELQQAKLQTNTNPLNTRLINPTLQQEHYNTVTLTYNASSSLDGRNFLSVATSLTPASKTCGAGFFHSISWSASCITTINLGFNLWWFDT